MSGPQTTTLRYFAWVRERTGRAEEAVVLPEGVATIADLVGWLSTRDESYAAAFAEGEKLRASIDRRHVKHDAAIAGAAEIAFFPPMTGG